jgi:antitoxin FitA
MHITASVAMISVRSARNPAMYTPAGTHSPENIGTERVDAIYGEISECSSRDRVRRWLAALDESATAGQRGRLSLDMRPACMHAGRMSKMIQIRNVPDALHRKLKVRAADAGQTLSDYLLTELERLAARPTRDEMLTRIHSRKRVTLKTPAATVIRAERESA